MNSELSFYGGPAGQPFEIAKIFNTKVELDSDLALTWGSPISDGQYVLISYGLPADEEYQTYRQKDIDTYGKSYNATLWKKIFVDKSGEFGGLDYQLVTAMPGNTPAITVKSSTHAADEDPTVKFEVGMVDGKESNYETPIFQFELPKAWSLNYTSQSVNPDQDPKVELVQDAENGQATFNFETPRAWQIEFAHGEPESQPKLEVLTSAETGEKFMKLTLPDAFIWQSSYDSIAADQEPNVTIDKSGNNAAFNFQFPKPWDISIQSTTKDAGAEPSIDVSKNADTGKIIATLNLPQAQVMGQPEVQSVGPAELPNVKFSQGSTVNTPKLAFSLPRAVKFFYGTALGENNPDAFYNTSLPNSLTGDYYINATTGFIYEVIGKIDANTATLRYVANLQSPTPSVTQVALSPYEASMDVPGTFTPAAPKVVRSVDPQNGWSLQFQIPKAPTPTIAPITFVGPEEQGTASVRPNSADSILFNFAIPRGANIFSGNSNLDIATIDGAKPGDIYLHSVSGNIYKLNSSNKWVKQIGNIIGPQGPQGKALNIVASYIISSNAGYADTLADGVRYIEEQYTGTIDSASVFAITYEETESSYWYFKTSVGDWGRVLLNSGFAGALENEYTTDSADSKVYTAQYVNEATSWGSFSDLIEEE